MIHYLKITRSVEQPDTILVYDSETGESTALEMTSIREAATHLLNSPAGVLPTRHWPMLQKSYRGVEVISLYELIHSNRKELMIWFKR